MYGSKHGMYMGLSRSHLILPTGLYQYTAKLRIRQIGPPYWIVGGAVTPYWL